MNQSDLLSFYRDELKRSKRWRNQDAYDTTWKRLIDLYRGRHYEGKTRNDRLVVNLAFATKNVMAPAVAINNPRFAVHARQPENLHNAIMTEEVLNYLWRTHRYQPEFRLAVDDWIIIGHGWVKTGYKFVKEPVAKKAGDVEDWDQFDDPDSNEGIDDRDDVEGNTETEMHITDDRPFVERISPFDVFVDPDARHPKEMRWIAQRTWRALQDVRVDERYSPTQRKRVGARSRSRWDGTEGDAREPGDSADRGTIQYCEIIEFYDLKRKKVSTFSPTMGEGDSGDGFLIRPADIPYAIGHPFVMLRNYEVPDHFYPMGDLEQIESLQLELNETRTQMINHRKRFARKYTYEEGAFDPDGVASLESDVDGVMVPVRTGTKPSDAVHALPAVITPPEFYNQSDLISDDIDRVSGISDYQRGAQSAIKRTATEAAMIQDAANARAQDRLAKIESILADVACNIIGLMQQYLTGEHVARVVSIPGRAWFNYTNEYIQGKFDYEVQGGSTEPRNETFRRQSALQLVDASMPFLEGGVANPGPLFQHILHSFGIRDVERYVMEQGPPPDVPTLDGPPQPGPGGPGAAGVGGPPGAPPPGPPADDGLQQQQLMELLFAQGGGNGEGIPPFP